MYRCACCRAAEVVNLMKAWVDEWKAPSDVMNVGFHDSVASRARDTVGSALGIGGLLRFGDDRH
jgi:hypothetical protein